MKLQLFISKNNIKVSPIVLGLCLTAMEIMTKSVDPAHDEKHVQDMLTNLNYLINKMPDIKKSINFDILLLSITWHDTWTSYRKPEYMIGYIFNQMAEGYGSAFLFRRYATNTKLNRKVIAKVFYTIVKHSSFQILLPINLESKILIDLDKIEMWNHFRMFKKEKDRVKERVQFFKNFWVRIYYRFLAFKSMYFKKLELLSIKRMKKFDKFIKNF